MTSQQIQKLTKRENEIWQRFQTILDDDVQKEIDELIEINLKLEQLNNQ